VILVDADLRHPVRSKGFGSHPALTELFRAGDRPGLSDLLAGTASLDEVALPADWPGLADNAGEQLVTSRSRGSGARLRFVAAGESADRTADVFERASLTRAFAEMKAAADVVVVDSAPVLAVSDAISLARASDLVVMVADVRRTGRGDVSVAAQEIRATGLRIIVGVLNRDRSRAKFRAPSGPGRPLESLVPPALPTDMIANGRQNGQRPAHLDAISARPYGSTDPGADPADPP
jgi:Mrp family chromosome partitioning ATPase